MVFLNRSVIVGGRFCLRYLWRFIFDEKLVFWTLWRPKFRPIGQKLFFLKNFRNFKHPLKFRGLANDTTLFGNFFNAVKQLFQLDKKTTTRRMRKKQLNFSQFDTKAWGTKKKRLKSSYYLAMENVCWGFKLSRKMFMNN